MLLFCGLIWLHSSGVLHYAVWDCQGGKESVSGVRILRFIWTREEKHKNDSIESLGELFYTNCQGNGPAKTKCTKIVVLRCQIGRGLGMTQYIICISCTSSLCMYSVYTPTVGWICVLFLYIPWRASNLPLQRNERGGRRGGEGN